MIHGTQGKECSPACRGSQSPCYHAASSPSASGLPAPSPPLLSELLLLLPLCSLAPSAPFPQGSGMAAIALIHKVFQFRNLKELSSKLLSLCGPPPHSHLCVPRVGPLCGPSPAQWRRRRREEPVEMWWILEESAVGVRASPEKSLKTQWLLSSLEVTSDHKSTHSCQLLSLTFWAALNCGLVSASRSSDCSFHMSAPSWFTSYFLDRIILFSDPFSSFPSNNWQFLRLCVGVYLLPLAVGPLACWGHNACQANESPPPFSFFLYL